MYFCGAFTQAPGHTEDMILSMRASVLGGALRARVTPYGPYRERYFAFFINGVYTGRNYWCPIKGDLEVLLPIPVGTTVASIFVEDAGYHQIWEPEQMYAFGTQSDTREALTSKSALIKWAARYALTDVYGSTDLSSITITGAKRGVNVGQVQDRPTRGRLSFSVTTPSGTYHIIRWYAGERLVAEGARTGNGAVTCSEVNGSGLSVACTLTYTVDIKAGAAIIDLCWPASYQIHYSTSALAYPRTPEATFTDNGDDQFLYLISGLSAGSYNYNVLQVDDEGDVQTAISAPADSPITINGAPAAPTITSVSGNAAALTVNWTVGEAGCTYTVYYSDPDKPINFGHTSLPAPITTALNATSATLAAITGYTAYDFSTTYATAAAAFDSAMSALSTAYNTGETGFLTAVDTCNTALQSAVDTFGTALGLRMVELKDRLEKDRDRLYYAAESLTGESLSTADFQLFLSSAYGAYIASVGMTLRGTAGRYTFPNGATVGGVDPADTTGIGAGPDGSTGINEDGGESLYSIAQPFVRSKRIRLVVRATKAGIQEQTDAEYSVEFDSLGAVIVARPNPATIESYSVTNGLTVNITAGVVEDDAAVVASYVDVYINAAGLGFTASSPTVTGTLPTAIANHHKIAVDYTVAAAGWYDIVLLARSAAGNRSETYTTRTEYISGAVPIGVSSISAKVIRGRGVRAQEA